jgi:sugar-specific transcriptional regulator TrmB
MNTQDGPDLLEVLELTEYETTALDRLLAVGRTTAPNLADATDIPNARIYSVLESLGNEGYIEIIPGRPKEYQPKAPEAILERAKANRRQAYETYRAEIEDTAEPFLEHYEPLYEQASAEVSPTAELFHVVDVGEPSLRETREIYRGAATTLHIMTKSFEYLDEVIPALRDVIEEVTIQVLFLHPKHLSAANSRIQATVLDRLDSEFPAVEYRFSNQLMPWRGTLADPSRDYETGTAIFLVEEKDIPLHMRQAAVTENGSFVAGMNRYFTLMWEHDSVADPD